MTAKDPHDLGPLPMKTRNQELERLSLQAFQDILPVNMFNMRDVRFEDYGVDIHIEVVHNGHPTNFLAHIQLKGSDRLNVNADNSISLQVAAANLNYILNSPLGIYVLYIAPTKELRYVWATSEYKRMERESPDWRTNAKVSLRFSKILDAAAIEEIHERIMEKSAFHRQYNDILARKEIRISSGLPDVHRITIDTEKRTITDATEALLHLKTEGISLVARGQSTTVLDLAQHASHSDLTEKVAQVVLAYAHYSVGHFIQCEANLANAQIGHGSLDPHQQYLLVTLRNACEFHMGDMTREEFLKSEKEAISHITDPVFKLQAQLYYLRTDIAGTFEVETRDHLYEECRQTVEAARQIDNATLHLQAEIAATTIEGNRCLYDFISLATETEGKIRLGLLDASAQTQINGKLNTDYQLWKGRVEKLIAATKLENDRLLYADAVLSGGVLLFGFLFHGKHMSIGLSKNFTIEPSAVESVILQTEEAVEIFTANSMKHDELRGKMLIADFYHFLGQSAKAKDIACPLLPIAKAMQYRPIVKHLESLLSEEHALQDLPQLIAEFQKTDDEDLLLAPLDDNALKRFAEFNASCHGMHPGLAQAELFAMRAFARERINWCRHLDVAVPMPGLWRCGCRKIGLVLATADRQPETVIAAFKEKRCLGCSLRQPKQAPQNT